MHSNPALELVRLCSHYDLADENILREQVKKLVPWDWATALKLMHDHRLEAYLWYHLQRIADELPPKRVRRISADFIRCLGIDAIQRPLIKELTARFSAQQIAHAFIKGIVLQDRLYAPRPIARGAADVDVLVFGGAAAMRVALCTCVALGFRLLNGEFSDLWQRQHDLSLGRALPDGTTLNIELQRAPADFFLSGKMATRLLSLFAARTTNVEWHDGIKIPVLDPTASLIHLAINVFKEARQPRLRELNDVALLIEKFGDTIDWDQLARIATELRLAPAMGVLLELASKWRGVRTTPIAYPNYLRWAIAPYLDDRLIVTQASAGIELSRARSRQNATFSLLFGWSALFKWCVAHERGRRRWRI